MDKACYTFKSLPRRICDVCCKTSKDPYKAMLNCLQEHTTEEVNRSPPAQLMMGRRLKSTLPATVPLLRPQGSNEVNRILKKRKVTQQYYDKLCGKELPALQPGNTVRMQHGDKWIPARVSYKQKSTRSYVVETPYGRKSCPSGSRDHVTSDF